MPRKPVFKIGDVVYYAGQEDDIPAIVSMIYDKEGWKEQEYEEAPCCVVTFIEPVKQSEIKPKEMIDSGEESNEVLGSEAFVRELDLCQGIENKTFCESCEDRSKCSDLQEIVRCEISRFGELRDEGKYNPDVCWQRKCIHTFYCKTNRFI